MAQKDLDDDEPEEATTNQYVGHITLNDVKFVFDLHSKYVRNYTKSEWLKPEQNKERTDFVTPLMQKFKIFKLLLDKTVYGLDYTVDDELLGALNVLASVAQNYGETKNLIGKWNLVYINVFILTIALGICYLRKVIMCNKFSLAFMSKISSIITYNLREITAYKQSFRFLLFKN